MQNSGQTARAHLKACTHSAHQRLHEIPQFKRLQHGTSSLEDYAGLMSVLATFYVALDALVISACRRHLNRDIPYTYRPRAPMIQADVLAVLRKLGRRPLAKTVGPDPKSVLPLIGSEAALAGVIYVIDGATLGGRLLNRSAGKLMGGEDASGRTYWQWCDTHGASQWKAALALIDTCGSEPSPRQEMAASALATFAALEHQFPVRASDDLAGAA